jgi:hypothetical protein
LFFFYLSHHDVMSLTVSLIYRYETPIYLLFFASHCYIFVFDNTNYLWKLTMKSVYQIFTLQFLCLLSISSSVLLTFAFIEYLPLSLLTFVFIEYLFFCFFTNNLIWFLLLFLSGIYSSILYTIVWISSIYSSIWFTFLKLSINSSILFSFVFIQYLLFNFPYLCVYRVFTHLFS